MTKETSIKLPPLIQKLMRWDELCVVDPRTLGDNPRNWKTHPQTQLDAVMAAVGKIGWVLPLLYNKTTGRLLDGHGRKAKAIASGITAVPVAKGRWTEQEENFILQSVDTIGSMYRIDKDRLKSLTALVTSEMSGLKDKSSATLRKLSTGIENLTKHIESGKRDALILPLGNLSTRKKPESEEVPDDEDDSEDTPEVSEEIPLDDIHFPGDDTWGIPVLDPALLCRPDQVPVRVFDRTAESVGADTYYCLSSQPWKERESSGIAGGTLGMFCEDYHFVGFYDNPGTYIEDLKDWDFSVLCQPDFSTFEDWPFPLRFWNYYRSRWVARYWQAHGFRILPILQSVRLPNPGSGNVEIIDIPFELNMELQPPVVACQCRTIKHNGGSFEEFGKWLKHQVTHIKPEVVVIYGGEEHRSKFEGYLPQKKGKHKFRYVYLPSFMANRRKLIKKGKAK